jgi:hypothetical protein
MHRTRAMRSLMAGAIVLLAATQARADILRWIDPGTASRYGIMVFARCTS